MSEANSDFEVSGTYESFVTVLVLNTVLAVVIFFAFWILRAIKANSYFFAPQFYGQSGTTDPLPDPGRGLFSWIPPVLNYTDEELFNTRGLDSLMYVKFLKYMCILFVSFAPLGLGVLLPLDATSGALEDQNGVPALSMANVPDNSSRLWAHSIYAMFCTLLTFYFLYRLYAMYCRYRIQWMKQDVANNYTVMYKGIPKETLKHTSPFDLFSQYFPGEVVDAQVGVDAGGLRKLIKKWDKTDEKLRFAQAALEENGTRQMKRTKPLCGHKIDAIEFYQQKLNELGAQIEAQRNSLLSNSEMSRVGFVTFRTVGMATQNAQLLMDRDATKLVPCPAPQPPDVYWKELELPRYWRPLALPISWLLSGILIIFWGTFVIFVQGLANLENLAKTNGFEWLQNVVNWNPVAYGLISGWLPSVLVIILFALLPKIIATIVRARGVYTRSELQRSVLKIYFVFLLVNLFLISLLGGSAIAILPQIVNSSGFQVLDILGQAVPAQSSFFINYILTYALFSYPMKILRVGPFIISKLKKRMAKSQAECRAAERPKKPFEYEFLTGIQLLMFVIGFTYAPIAPFILPWTIIFFLFTYLFGKYLLIYVYSPKFDSGGLLWPVIFNRLITGMFVAQIIMIGVFVFKTHPSLVFVVPLPFLTIAFYVVMHRLFDRPSSFLSMNEYPLAANNGEIYRHLYKDPVMQLDTHASIAGRNPSILSKHNNDIEEGNNRNMAGYGSI